MKILSLILRHKPGLIGIILENEGWADTNDLICGLNKLAEFKETPIDFEELCFIVETNNKKRFEFNSDKTKIRACQGHSVCVDLQNDWVKFIPFGKTILYHGTSDKFLNSILEKGLLPQSRTHVHLSQDRSTAFEVGKGHGGKTVILKINATEMYQDGYEFFQASNGTILIKEVPTKYILV